jgi:hypothetical protein
MPLPISGLVGGLTTLPLPLSTHAPLPPVLVAPEATPVAKKEARTPEPSTEPEVQPAASLSSDEDERAVHSPKALPDDSSEPLAASVEFSQVQVPVPVIEIPIPSFEFPSNPDQAACIAEAFQSDLARNLQVMETQRRYSDETYNAAFVMRTLSCKTDEFLRGLIPLPQVKLLDERFKKDLEAIHMQST